MLQILFEKMLELENILPKKIAFDRPSDKLIKFLTKYYNLKDYIPQNNNYVIFNEYFVNKQTNKNNNSHNYVDNNNKYTNSNWDNNNNNCKSQGKPRTLGATSSMVNLNSKSISLNFIKNFF